VLLIKIFALLILLIVFFQDILYRSVHWFLFPTLTILFIVLRLLSGQSGLGIAQWTVINVSFILLVLLILSMWFSLKEGGWVNITTHLLGWGDILFLMCCAFYFSVLNFLFFYISSLIGVLFCWIVWQIVSSSKKNNQIPLAGLQAVILIIFLINDWWLFHLGLTNDEWLLNMIVQ
jgi:hypothetical protein